jgi:tetratricopeptide (TPR) repeat protein
MIERDGPERTADELHRLVSDTQEAVDEFGVCFLGSDADADGGKLILVAGAPRAMGEDEERMLLAVRKIVSAERRIPVRIGVNHGGVFAGDVGPSYRRTYTVMGDTVNLAARLMAKAPPAEVYATASVLDRSATKFDLTELEPFMVKGKARPVEAWSVGAPVFTRASESGVRTLPLAGRDAEMKLLREALAGARGGEIRSVLVTGESGIGKTRLAEELRAEADGFTLVGTVSDAYTSSTPYMAWRETLRQVLGVGWEDPSEIVVKALRDAAEASAPELLPWLPLIATAADAEMPPTPEMRDLSAEFVRQKLHESVLAFLRAAVTTPTVFEFENALLMDEASAELLAAAASMEPADRPWLFLILRRPGPGGFVAPESSPVRTVEVGPIADEAVTALAESATDDAPLPPHVLREAVTRAGGNPQLLLDLLLAASTGTGALPESVEAAAIVRIDNLSPLDRQLVRRASVLGQSFNPRLLDEVLGEEELPSLDDRVWDRLAEFFEVQSDGYVRFRRVVVRDAAYAGLPFRVRRALHGAVGDRIERESSDPDEAAGILSMHFALAGEHERAWRYAALAGRRAKDIFANVEAATFFARAIEAGRRAGAPPAELMALHEALGDVQHFSGVLADAARALGDARRLARTDPVSEARILMKRARVEERLGRYPSALRWLTKARTALREDAAPDAVAMAAEIDARYAAVVWREGRLVAAIRRCERAIEAAEKSGARSALASAHNIMGAALALLGRPGAEDHWRQALDIFEELGDLPGQAAILVNLGAGAYFDGDWNAALDLYRRAVEACERTGDPINAADGRVNIAEILVDQGRDDEAKPVLRATMRVWRATGANDSMAFTLALLGRTAVRAGEVEEALQLLEEAHALFTSIGAKGDALDVDAHRAEVLVAAGRWREAAALAERAIEGGRAHSGTEAASPLLARVLGYARAQAGDLEGAEAMFEESLRESREREAGYDMALAIHALTRVRTLRGAPMDPELPAEADRRLEHLGIVSVLAPPLVPWS